jgi:hypothetical protein
MCKYKGGLNGKHFKTIVQVMSFAVMGLVSDALINAWLALGRLTVLCWHTQIDNLEVYLVCR